MYTTNDRLENREKGLYLGSQIIWYIFSVIEGFLILRFILKSFGANTDVWFTEFIYRVSGFFMMPFDTIFGSSSPAALSGSIFEWDILFAIIVYWVVALGIIKLFGMGRKVSVEEAHDDLEKNS